jgi:hypothetical protein
VTQTLPIAWSSNKGTTYSNHKYINVHNNINPTKQLTISQTKQVQHQQEAPAAANPEAASGRSGINYGGRLVPHSSHIQLHNEQTQQLS